MPKSPQWSGDGRQLFFQYDDHGTTRIASRRPLKGKVRVLANDVGGTDVTRPYAGGSFSVSRKGRFAYTRASTTEPAVARHGHVHGRHRDPDAFQ